MTSFFFCKKNWINLDNRFPIFLFFRKFREIIVGPYNLLFQGQKKAASYGVASYGGMFCSENARVKMSLFKFWTKLEFSDFSQRNINRGKFKVCFTCRSLIFEWCFSALPRYLFDSSPALITRHGRKWPNCRSSKIKKEKFWVSRFENSARAVSQWERGYYAARVVIGRSNESYVGCVPGKRGIKNRNFISRLKAWNSRT